MANPGNVSPTPKSVNSNLSSIDPSFKIVDTFQSSYKKWLLDAGESCQVMNFQCLLKKCVWKMKCISKTWSRPRVAYLGFTSHKVTDHIESYFVHTS